MKVFAVLKDLLPASEFALDLPSGARCETAFAKLGAESDRICTVLSRCLIAVNGEFATRDLPLRDGDELAVLPPVSGG